MTTVVITIAAKTPEADPLEDRLELHLPRCKLPRCQKVIAPSKDFCINAHRAEFNRKFKGFPSSSYDVRTLQASLQFDN